MPQENEPLFVYTTFASVADAREMGKALVGARLAACVNIFEKMTSIYEWDGKLEEASEIAMLIKSRRGLEDKLLGEARKRHPYETPSLVVLNVTGGDQDFIDWIVGQTSRG